MSNIGKKPVVIPEGVTVEVEEGMVKITGQKGTLTMRLPYGVSVSVLGGAIEVKNTSQEKEKEKLFGLARALIANMVEGVTRGFEKKLEMVGVGFRGRVEMDALTLHVGYSVPVTIPAAEGIAFSVAENVITVSGIDKQLVGDVASKIRSVRAPDPYKGKGIRYVGEKIRRKAGKAAKAAVGTK